MTVFWELDIGLHVSKKIILICIHAYTASFIYKDFVFLNNYFAERIIISISGSVEVIKRVKIL